MIDNLTLLKSNKVLEMITVAYDFCLFTESLKGKKMKEVNDYYQKVLPLLYIKGALLPQVVVNDESANVKYVTEEHWQEVFMVLEEIYGKEDKYWFPDHNNDLIKESMADNIADIYQDMKDFVVLFQDSKLASKENAVADLKRLFGIHWGMKTTKAAYKIHLTMFNNEIAKEDINF